MYGVHQMSLPMDRPPARVAPDSVTWSAAGDSPAHAFPRDRGWMRSICGDIRWSVLLHRVPEPTAHGEACGTCSLLVYGTEAEKREAFGG